jgi:Flp pilus assembly pilin Flp
MAASRDGGVVLGRRKSSAGRRHHAFISFLGDERGATSLEYCFIACLISIVAVTAMTQIGSQTLANTSSVLTGFSR